MTIQIYIGTLGSGKTLSMVRDLYMDSIERKRKVISNLVLSFSPNIISKEFFEGFAQGQQQELFDIDLGIDEMHIFLDSRSSTTKASKYLSYFILQTRKRGVELKGTTQFYNQIDKRLRNVCDYITKCQGFIKRDNGWELVTPIMASRGLSTEQAENLWIFNATFNQEGKEIKKEIFKAKNFFDKYDTKQIIDFSQSIPTETKKKK
jgi:hypothetical protein